MGDNMGLNRILNAFEQKYVPQQSRNLPNVRQMAGYVANGFKNLENATTRPVRAVQNYFRPQPKPQGKMREDITGAMTPRPGWLDNPTPGYGPGDKNLVPPPNPITQTPVAPTPPPAQSSYNPLYETFMKNIGKIPTPQSVPPPDELKNAVMTASQKYKIPPDLLYTMAHKEAGFKNIPEHIGGHGRGYFQIDDRYHPDVSNDQAYDPMFAADWAAKNLAGNLDYFSKDKNPVTSAIRAHNGGPGWPKYIGSKKPKEIEALKRSQDYIDAYIEELKNFKWE